MERQLGSRYVLESVIGRGGFGQVWRGRDLEGNVLAFKVLHPSFGDDPRAVEKFVQERSILLSLDHPNLVRVRDMIVEGDTFAFAMDLVEGGDLRSQLRARGPMPVEGACQLAAAVAAALAAIHAKGIVHRDVKPENVLIDSTSDGSIVPRLTDFGIARLESSTRKSTVFTGTPTYVAPELFDDGPATPASDLYALGVMLYELVAGAPPFKTDSILSLMRMHLEKPRQRPRAMSDDLWSLVSELQAKVPADRPQSAAVVAARLATMIVPAPVEETQQRLVRPKNQTTVHLANEAEMSSSAGVEVSRGQASTADQVGSVRDPGRKRSPPAARGEQVVRWVHGVLCVLLGGAWLYRAATELHVAIVSTSELWFHLAWFIPVVASASACAVGAASIVRPRPVAVAAATAGASMIGGIEVVVELVPPAGSSSWTWSILTLAVVAMILMLFAAWHKIRRTRISNIVLPAALILTTAILGALSPFVYHGFGSDSGVGEDDPRDAYAHHAPLSIKKLCASVDRRDIRPIVQWDDLNRDANFSGSDPKIYEGRYYCYWATGSADEGGAQNTITFIGSFNELLSDEIHAELACASEREESSLADAYVELELDAVRIDLRLLLTIVTPMRRVQSSTEATSR